MPVSEAFGNMVYEGQEALIADWVLGDLPKSVGLFKSSFTPTQDSVAADFAINKADFTGYAIGTPTFTAGNDGDGHPILAGSQVTYTAGTPITVTNSLGGIYVLSNAGVAVAFAIFDNPIDVSLPGQTLKVSCSLRVDGGLAFEIIA